MRDEISHFKVRGRQVKDGQSFHCLNMCFSVEDYSAVANASISCVSFLENPLFHFERKKFLILFLFVCSVLFFGEVLVLLKNGTLCQHNNQFLKPKKTTKNNASPFLSEGYSALRHRRIQLRPGSLTELDSISSSFIYPTDAIPFNLQNNKNNIPARPF